MQSCVCVLIALIGCGRVASSNGIDGPISIDSTLVDASQVCDPMAKFGAAIPVMGLPTMGAAEVTPRLSPDELTIYFSGTVPGSDENLYVAHRSSVSEAFEAPRLLSVQNSIASDEDPSISSDGLTLWFDSDRIVNEGYHLYVATRLSTLAEFGPPGRATIVNAADVLQSDQFAFVTADGLELWFASTRSPGIGGLDIWHAPRSGAGFDAPVMAAELDSTANDDRPSLSSDRLTIYFASNRSAAGPKSDYDIWRSTRSTVNDGFSVPKLVDELNTAGDDRATWLSTDNCRIYGTSSNSGTFVIFMATRQH